MSKPLKSIHGELVKLNTVMGGSGSGGVTTATKKAEASFGGLATAWNQTLEIAGKVTDALIGLGKTGLDAASFVVSAASYKQATTTALQSILHVTKDEAKEVFGEISKIANTTPFESADVANTIKKLIGSGFSKNDAFAAFQSIGDVSAFNNFDVGVLDQLSSALGRIKSQGKLTGESLQMLLDAGHGSIGRADLAKALGLTADQLTSAKIDAAKALPAIFSVITKGVSGGKAGSLMAQLGQELPGLFSTLKDVPFSLIPSVDDSAGLGAFRDFVRKLVGLFDDSNPSFVKIKKSVGRIIDAVFGGFSGVDGSMLEGLFGKVADVVEDIANFAEKIDFKATFGGIVGALEKALPLAEAFLGGAWSGLSTTLGPMFEGLNAGPGSASTWKAIGLAIGTIAGGIVIIGEVTVKTATAFGRWATSIYDVITGVGSIGDVFSAVFAGGGLLGALGVFDGIFDKALSIGDDFIQGIIEGIESGASRVVDAVAGLADSVVDTAKGILDINSPSRVMMEIGGYTAEGFAMGVEQGAPLAGAAVTSMLAAPAVGDAGGSGGGGNSSRTDITINFGRDVDPKDKAAVRQNVDDSVRVALRRYGRDALTPGAP
jgi:hypothetical protein